jgi:tRNA-binding protein
MASIEDFQRLDLRVGRIVEAEDFPKARKPSYRLLIDFGSLGRRRSVAALKNDYALAGVDSEVLVLAATEPDGTLRLLTPDTEAEPGSPIS